VPIPADAVDEEQVARPRPWNIGEIKRFILYIGPVSSIFDYTTFFVMLWIFNCWNPSRAPLFQTGWFVESLMTQTLIIHVIRTNKIPFLQSRASWALTATTLSIMAFAMWLPYSPLASALGFTHLPRTYWPILMLTLLGYVGLVQFLPVFLLALPAGHAADLARRLEGSSALLGLGNRRGLRRAVRDARGSRQ